MNEIIYEATCERVYGIKNEYRSCKSFVGDIMARAIALGGRYLLCEPGAGYVLAKMAVSKDPRV